MIRKDLWGERFQNPVPTFAMIGSWLKSLGYRQIVVAGSAVGVGAVPIDTTFTLIVVEGGDIRFRDDGTNPTASIGMLVPKGATLKYDADPTALKAIAVSAAATLNVTFYGIGGTDA